MFNIFSSQNPIGINISDSSIKLAQIGSKGSLRILKKIRLPEGFVINGEIIKEDETADVLRELIKETNKLKKINAKEVVCAISEKIAYLKILTINNPNGNIDSQILVELSKQLPEDTDKLYIDWQILNETADNSANSKIEIIAGAGRRDLIEKNIRVIEKAGLLPILIEIESLSTARALIFNEKKTKTIFLKEPDKSQKESPTIGILDIGLKTSSFIIYKKTVNFSIDMPFSDEKIIKLISESLNITYAQAKKAKSACGMDPKKARGNVKKILTPYIAEIAKHIKKIEEYHINYNNGDKFDKILLCGGGASLLAIDKAIEENTKIKTSIGNATINLKTPPSSNIELLEKETIQYEASIGSALIGYWLCKK
ncbi:MAG: pilus assembly protein PilM [bacterium]